MLKSQMLEEAILSDLRKNHYKKNDKLPSRNMLCTRFKCSRTTVEKAINALKKRGVLFSSQGAPTRVLDLSEHSSGEITDLYLIARGLEIYSHESIREMFLPGEEENIRLHTLGDDQILKQLSRLCAPGSALVWIMPKIRNLALMEHFRQKEIPQILINRSYGSFSSACTDTVESLREGLSYLMAEGGRRLALVSRNPNMEQPYLAERLLAFYENVLSLKADVAPDNLYIRDFSDIPKEMSETGLQLFGGSKMVNGIVVLDSNLTLPLVTCGLIYGKHPGKDYFLLTFDKINELCSYEGIAMMRQQDEKLFLATKQFIKDGYAARRQLFTFRIKTELIKFRKKTPSFQGRS